MIHPKYLIAGLFIGLGLVLVAAIFTWTGNSENFLTNTLCSIGTFSASLSAFGLAIGWLAETFRSRPK